MAKTKYYYDHNSCSYKKIKVTKSIFLKEIFKSAVIISISSFSFISLRDRFYDSPKEVYLKKENASLKKNYKLILNKFKEIDNLAEEVEKKDTVVYRTVLGANPIPKPMRKKAIGGIEHYAEYKDLDKDNVILNIHKEADELIHKLNVQLRSHKEILSLAKKRNIELACTPSIQPVDNKDLRRLSSGFGNRMHPTLGIRKMHWGQDFAVLPGTSVYATAHGFIKKIKNCPRGGLTIIINHGIFETAYCHLKSYNKDLKKGSYVKRGQKIAKSGNSGRTSGPHLHYAVKKKGKYVNPIYYFYKDLTPSQFSEVKKLVERDIVSMD